MNHTAPPVLHPRTSFPLLAAGGESCRTCWHSRLELSDDPEAPVRCRALLRELWAEVVTDGPNRSAGGARLIAQDEVLWGPGARVDYPACDRWTCAEAEHALEALAVDTAPGRSGRPQAQLF